MKVVIIGGVAGGATAAARIRRLDERAEIIILERSGYVSYANCGLPYYIGGGIRSKTKLVLQTPQSFNERFKIDVRVRNEVLAINRENKTVTVKQLDNNKIYSESYDKLILSPGAKPLLPDIKGMDDQRIFIVRTVEDTFKIYDYIEQQKPRKAVLAGGGYIGLEMAENLVQRGIEVTIVQRPNQVMAQLDYDMACKVHDYLRQQGIRLKLKSSVTGFEATTEGVVTHNKEKSSLLSDMVILAIGVVPETHLARQAGLELGVKNAITVNEHMQTSDPDIYAVGDAVEIKHFVTGSRAVIALAGPANKQGRIAADNICGRNSVFGGSQGTSIIKLFDLTVAATGINEKTAESSGIKFQSAVITAASHASYYPGATNMTIKTLFAPDSGKLLGAQIVGFDGVDKRIDVLAVAVRAGMTAYDLTELDLAYAPPFSSAKDPVNMVGYVMENLLTGLVKQVSWQEVAGLAGYHPTVEGNRGRDVFLLDARTEKEYSQGYIGQAVNIPLNQLRARLDELPKDKSLYVYCQSGLRSYIACRILSQNGFDCYNLSGGYGYYQSIIKDQTRQAAESD